MKQPPALPTYHHQLAIFLSHLREHLGISQEKVATHFCLDRGRVSRYETTTAPDNPKLGYLTGLACLIAAQENNQPAVHEFLLQQVNQAIHHHYRHRRFPTWAALHRQAEIYLTNQRHKFTQKMDRQWQIRLEKRLDLPPATDLIGFETYLDKVGQAITTTHTPWLVCLEGLGGLGKTALANAFVRQAWLANRFQNVGWVSAKRREYLPGIGLQEVAAPALTVETLVDSLLEQFDQATPFPTPAQRLMTLTDLLKGAPFLIVIDNLETLEAYQALIPTLLKWANPTKFLLTSRASLKGYADVYALSLDELSQADTLALIRQEAQRKGLTTVADAPEVQLDRIYQVVGGNPLALKLVVGQLAILELPQVLNNLQQARGKDNTDLYNFLYWAAWHLLSPFSQQVFLAMPLVEAGTIDQLAAATRLDRSEVGQALQQLVDLSLVQVKVTTLQNYRYTIHSLTQTFLLTEALKWKQ